MHTDRVDERSGSIIHDKIGRGGTNSVSQWSEETAVVRIRGGRACDLKSGSRRIDCNDRGVKSLIIETWEEEIHRWRRTLCANQ